MVNVTKNPLSDREAVQHPLHRNVRQNSNGRGRRLLLTGARDQKGQVPQGQKTEQIQRARAKLPFQVTLQYTLDRTHFLRYLIVHALSFKRIFWGINWIE